MAKILTQIEAHNIGNIRLYAGDAAELLAWAPPRSLARIDLIHPDPWPKRRHWKRRFVQDATVDAMARILKDGGEFRFVSDIDDYCAWTLAHLMRSSDFLWTAERAADWRQPWDGYTMTRYGRKAEREGRVAAYLRFRRVGSCTMARHSEACAARHPGSILDPHGARSVDCRARATRRTGMTETLPLRLHLRLPRIRRFPHHALAALAPQQLDRIVIVDVAELSLVDAVAA